MEAKAQRDTELWSAAVVLRRLSGGYWSALAILCALCIVFTAAQGNNFLSLDNFRNIAANSTALTLIVIGLTLVVQTGDFDLSFPGIISLTTLVAAALSNHGWPIALVCLTAIGVGLVVGCVNGSLVSFWNLTSFVATIGTGGIATALATFMNSSQPIPIRSNAALVGLANGDLLRIPSFVIVLVVGLGIGWLVLTRSEAAFLARAIGSNATAADRTGVSVGLIKIIAFAVAGAYAGFAGVFVTSQQGSGFIAAGPGFLFTAYVAVYLGAAFSRLGHFNFYGSICGVVIVGILSDGLVLLGVPTWFTSLVTGFVFIGVLLWSRVGLRSSGA